MNLFKPGATLLNRLPFSRKFQLILAVIVLPLIYGGQVIYTDESEAIKVIDAQFAGMATVTAMHPMRIVAAKHRGTSAQWLAGNAGIVDKVKALEVEMAQAMKKARAQFASQNFNKSTQATFETLLNDWDKLNHAKLQSMGGKDSFTNHTAWISRLTGLIDVVAGESRLVLDRHIDTYMLMNLLVFDFPALQEALGQLRGRGAGVATEGGFNPDSFVAVNGLYSNIQSSQAEIKRHFDFVMAQNPTMGAKLENTLNAMKSAVSTFDKTTGEQLISPDEPTISGQDYFAQGTQAIKGVAGVYKMGLDVYKNQILEYRSDVEGHMALVFTVFISLVLLGWYLFSSLKSAVDKNVHITQDMATDLEDGNLTGDYISDSKDELGSTIEHLNHSFHQIRKVVTQVRDNSSGLLKTSSELQGVSGEVNNLGQQQKHKVEVIVTSANELASTAKVVASHCEGAADETQNAQNKAVDGAKRSQASANVIRELAEGIRKAGDEISQLAQQAASISTVIDVIKAIAEQTNLLALNAAIEAARAGEQGRGFAVVADEVRTLANRTQESTNEIENTISSLQSVAEHAVLAMESACEQADVGEKEAMEIGEVLADIERSVEQVSTLIQQVATAGSQQANAAGQIADNIHTVDDASSELVEKSQSMASIAGSVDEGSRHLEKTVSQFQV